MPGNGIVAILWAITTEMNVLEATLATWHGRVYDPSAEKQGSGLTGRGWECFIPGSLTSGTGPCLGSSVGRAPH